MGINVEVEETFNWLQFLAILLVLVGLALLPYVVYIIKLVLA